MSLWQKNPLGLVNPSRVSFAEAVERRDTRKGRNYTGPGHKHPDPVLRRYYQQMLDERGLTVQFKKGKLL